MIDKKTIKDRAQGVMDQVITWRRHIHEHPEAGYDLPETVHYVASVLDDLGVDYDMDEEDSYVIAYLNKGQGDKVIAVRADMDALEVQEETGLDFASKNEGIMHACGHDAHTAALLGLIALLRDHEGDLNGEVRFFFQPAEEMGDGSLRIIKDGHLEGVDEILAMHNGNLAQGKPLGTLLHKPGPMSATMDKFTLDILGKSAHGSTPHDAVDPITIASYMIVSLQEILSRELDPREPAVITVGSIAGGKGYNVIPGKVHLEGTVRVYNDKIRDQVEKRMGEICRGVAQTFRARADFAYLRQPPPLVNDEAVANRLIEVSKALYPEDTVVMKKPALNGEDFAWYLQDVPGAYFFLHNPREVEGEIWPNHNEKFDIEEDYLVRPIAVLAAYLLKELGE